MIAHLMAASVLAATSPTPEEARRSADEILSRVEFQEPPKSIPDQVTDWISERLVDLFMNLAGSGTLSLVTWLVLAALAAIVGFVVYRVARTLRPVPLVRGHVVGGEPDRTAADWRAEAESFEAAGSWKAALRARYRALVGDLVERSVVRDVPGRTTGEYRREIASRAPLASPSFDEATELFEEAWYGDVPTGAEENAQIRALTDRVIASLPASKKSVDAPEAGVPA